jgi:hypothetical protein
MANGNMKSGKMLASWLRAPSTEKVEDNVSRGYEKFYLSILLTSAIRKSLYIFSSMVHINLVVVLHLLAQSNKKN